MWLPTSLLVAIPLVLAASSYDQSYSKLFESVYPPHGWIPHGPAPAEHFLTLRIGLRRPHFHVLDRHLWEVSDPAHARYGQHLSKAEVDALVAPNASSVTAVEAWLAAHGIAAGELTRSSAGDWIRARVSVSVAEKMLNAKYDIWINPSTHDTLVRTTSYSLPAHLHSHIDVVQPTTLFSRFKAQRSTVSWPPQRPESSSLYASSPGSLSESAPTSLTDGIGPFVNTPYGPVESACNNTITITCLQQLYRMVNYTPGADLGNGIAVTGFLEQYANNEDLRSFYAEQRPDAIGSAFQVVNVNGGTNDQNSSVAGDEADLDAQFAFGLTYPIQATFYTVGGQPPFIPDAHTSNNTNEPYQDWLDYILAEQDPPRVISTSYGDEEQTVPRSYAVRVCQEFAQLGARGVTLIFASGDFGVGDGNPDPETQECFTNDGRNVTRFMPVFPASCPYVTAVGGVQFINPEIAVSRFSSGGGFSDYFDRPGYQSSVVDGYLDRLGNDTYAGLFNRQAFPDVAAQGENYRFILSGKASLIGGTSAAAPTFAAVVALLNDVRLRSKQSSLGFLNPLLYAEGVGGLNDIVSGRNPGCGTQGFNATEGWDPVTGLGTPNFEKLKALVQGSSPQNVTLNSSSARSIYARMSIANSFVFCLWALLVPCCIFFR